jgi:hypothetical protein
MQKQLSGFLVPGGRELPKKFRERGRTVHRYDPGSEKHSIGDHLWFSLPARGQTGKRRDLCRLETDELLILQSWGWSLRHRCVWETLPSQADRSGHSRESLPQFHSRFAHIQSKPTAPGGGDGITKPWNTRPGRFRPAGDRPTSFNLLQNNAPGLRAPFLYLRCARVWGQGHTLQINGGNLTAGGTIANAATITLSDGGISGALNNPSRR